MVKCPNCGAEVSKPIKSWSMKPRRRSGPEIKISLYECPKCHTKFRTGEKTKKKRK